MFPSPTAEPTATPTEVPPEPTTPPEPTAAPPGPFREEFDDMLNPAWTWVNEDPERWVIADGVLQITAADPPFAADTTEIPMVNLLTRAIPDGVDIAATTYVSASVDENFEQAALYLIEDGDSFVLLNIGFCEFCGGKGVYLEAYADGQSLLEGLQFFPLPEEVTEVWLRLEYSPSGNAIVALVALTEGSWERVGQIIRQPPAINSLGIGAINLPGPGSNPEEDLVAQYEFVELEVYD